MAMLTGTRPTSQNVIHGSLGDCSDGPRPLSARCPNTLKGRGATLRVLQVSHPREDASWGATSAKTQAELTDSSQDSSS
jgi:hypothetical protein